LPDFSWRNTTKREKYTVLAQHIPNGHQIYKNGRKIDRMSLNIHLPLQDTPIFTQIEIFGLKIYIPYGNPMFLYVSFFFRVTRIVYEKIAHYVAQAVFDIINA
jgi:hypothetical protein